MCRLQSTCDAFGFSYIYVAFKSRIWLRVERSRNCLQLRVHADGFGYDQVIGPISKFPARRQGFVHLYSLLNFFGCICAAYPEQIVKVLRTDNKALGRLACRNNFHRQEQFKQMITCECSLSCAHTLHESKVKWSLLAARSFRNSSRSLKVSIPSRCLISVTLYRETGFLWRLFDILIAFRSQVLGCSVANNKWATKWH